MYDFDTIILGTGTMGAAAAMSLTRAGERVLGLDRFEPPHHYGAHHGEVRMFRMSYYEDPAYVPLLRAALMGWRDIEARRGVSLLELTGAAYFGLPDSELIAGASRSAAEHGLAHERLDSAEIAARFPALTLDPDCVGLFERDAGYVRCERAVSAMLEDATASGRFTLRTGEAASSWLAADSGIVVTTGAGVYHAKRLVIAAGAWSSRLLTDLGVPLVVTRQVQAWATPSAARGAGLGALPCWAIDPGDSSLFYGFPCLRAAGRELGEVKLARHARGSTTDAAVVSRDCTGGDLEEVRGLIGRHIPSLAGAPLRGTICLYTNSPDSHFIIDRHPLHANVAFACGFSGHGFKFAPAVGDLLRELVLNSDAAHPRRFFGLDRVRR